MTTLSALSARALLLSLFVFTGPVPDAPATSAQTIHVTVPAALSLNPPVCVIG